MKKLILFLVFFIFILSSCCSAEQLKTYTVNLATGDTVVFCAAGYKPYPDTGSTGYFVDSESRAVAFFDNIENFTSVEGCKN